MTETPSAAAPWPHWAGPKNVAVLEAVLAFAKCYAGDKRHLNVRMYDVVGALGFNGLNDRNSRMHLGDVALERLEEMK